jgi:hypothetical protein
MAGDKRKASKARGGGRKGGAAAFGVAGALSLATCICGACKASASTTSTGNSQTNTRVLLAEEEISDVSLSTFYVFDKENARIPGVKLAAGHGGGCGGHGARMRPRLWRRRVPRMPRRRLRRLWRMRRLLLVDRRRPSLLKSS